MFHFRCSQRVDSVQLLSKAARSGWTRQTPRAQVSCLRMGRSQLGPISLAWAIMEPRQQLQPSQSIGITRLSLTVGKCSTCQMAPFHLVIALIHSFMLRHMRLQALQVVVSLVVAPMRTVAHYALVTTEITFLHIGVGMTF